MSGDYSRVRFDPRIDMAGVLMQQGRVQLDSDWNEWVAVLDRRLRAESVDTFGVNPTPGFTGVAVVSPQTPDAFKIEASGGSITIGRGRMYVDGLLAENHGGGTQEFDPVLAELRGQTALVYSAQPYFPAPPALPGGGPHLAYLEVWQREVTYLQRPDLVESAVAVDTTTRWQTIWQVRLLANAGAGDCTTPEDQFPAWQTLIRPSAGRLSIRAEGVPPDQDPCELPPSGGYRGLENQLYRIEIHDGGGVGTATFKWSRDNASVASGVTEIVSHTATATELKLASLGRDAVLRFNTGDWVEIVDDRRELSGENADPALRRGVMRKITVDEAKQTVSFSPALPGDLIPGGGADTLASRHTRVKRWDQKGTVRDADNNLIADLDAAGSSGLIPVPAAGVWVVLEKGVEVQFGLDPAGGDFTSGDYWVSAARAADSSVETFSSAPPRGIHRHYARLATITFPDGETDCRTPWPPACAGCCTVTVAPGENIQTAINSLPTEGGCVCLKTGVHNVGATLQILSSRIILRGESPGVVVRSAGLERTLQIGNADTPVTDIVIQSVRFDATAAAPDLGVLLNLENCARVRVECCTIAVVVPAAQLAPSYVGVQLSGVADIRLSSNRLQTLLIGILCNDYQHQLHIVDNAIEGITGLFLNQPDASLGQYGMWIDTDHSYACRIENNRIRHFWIGIYLRAQAESSIIVGNRVSRSAGTTDDVPPTSDLEVRQYLENRLYGIDVEAPRCAVHDNWIDLLSIAWGGIRVSGADVSVTANTLASALTLPNVLVPAAIYCFADAKRGNAADRVVVRDNRLSGPQAGIVVSRIAEAAVNGNQIDGGGAGWYGVRLDECSDTHVAGNDMRDIYFVVHLTNGARNRVTDNRIIQAATGITSVQESDLEATGNTLQSCLVLGIALYVRGATAVLENRVLNCGYASTLSIGVGVYAEEVWLPSGAHLRIQGCEVIDTGISADGTQATTSNAIGLGGWVPNCQITHNRVGYTQPAKLAAQGEHRALLFMGPLGYRVALASGVFEIMFGSALVDGNHFRGPGQTHLVEFFRLILTDNFDFRFEKLSFSNNICDHLNTVPAETVSTARLWGGHLIAVGNHIKAPDNVNSMSLANRNKVALMGNVTTGDYVDVGTVTPTPHGNFNVRT